MQQQMDEMQRKANDQQNNNNNSNTRSKVKQGDYIDYEEVK